MFRQNSIFVTETHVYAKPLTPNRRVLPSNACLVSEYVSKQINQKRAYHSSREINNTYNGSQTEVNDFYDSIIIAKTV